MIKIHASFTLHAQTHIPAPSGAFLLGLNKNLCLHLYILQYATTQFLKTGRRSYSVLKIDEPGEDGLFGLHILKTVGYKGLTSSAETLDLHGFDVEALDDSRLRFWMVNHRPPVDEKNIALDANKLGANSTIEVFEVTRGSSEMIHVSTISNEVIATPNKVAAVGDGGVLISNDHNIKNEVSYHSSSPNCSLLTTGLL